MVSCINTERAWCPLQLRWKKNTIYTTMSWEEGWLEQTHSSFAQLMLSFLSFIVLPPLHSPHPARTCQPTCRIGVPTPQGTRILVVHRLSLKIANTTVSVSHRKAHDTKNVTPCYHQKATVTIIYYVQ